MELFELIRKRLRDGFYKVTLHAYNEANADNLEMAEIRKALWVSGEMIEDYPEDPRGHSCLALGWIHDKPVHAVCGMVDEEAIVITVYIPEPEKWVEFRTRRKKL